MILCGSSVLRVRSILYVCVITWTFHNDETCCLYERRSWFYSTRALCVVLSRRHRFLPQQRTTKTSYDERQGWSHPIKRLVILWCHSHAGLCHRVEHNKNIFSNFTRNCSS